MKLYIEIVSPKLLDFFGIFSPLGVGGIGNMTVAPFVISRDPMSKSEETHEYIHILQTYEVGVVTAIVLGPALALAGLPWWAVLSSVIWPFVPASPKPKLISPPLNYVRNCSALMKGTTCWATFSRKTNRKRRRHSRRRCRP